MPNKAMKLHRGPLICAGLLLGTGLGGFVDGILLHQILQWHNMLSSELPPTNLIDMKVNMVWDGFFHALTWTMTLAGVAMLFRAGRRADSRGRRAFSWEACPPDGDSSISSRVSSTTSCSGFTTCARDPASSPGISFSRVGYRSHRDRRDAHQARTPRRQSAAPRHPSPTNGAQLTRLGHGKENAQAAAELRVGPDAIAGRAGVNGDRNLHAQANGAALLCVELARVFG